MSRAHAGEDYVRAMQRCACDREARRAFQLLALRIVPAGGTIFDFGAGAGLDARFFAERGLRVRVYDSDYRMRRHLAATCRDLIDAGRIVPESGDYADFLVRPQSADAPCADLVIANFAPLDLIEDLPLLFEKLHTLTAPAGGLLASVLSPYFIGDLKLGWRWRGMIGLWRTGRLTVPGAHGNVIRRRLPCFAAECGPRFRLARVFRGLPPRTAAQAAGIDFAQRPRTAWLHLTGCRFMFLLFRKLPPAREDRARPAVATAHGTRAAP